MADESYPFIPGMTVNYSSDRDEFIKNLYEQARLFYYEGKRISPFVCPESMNFREADRIGRRIFAEVEAQYHRDKRLNTYMKKFWESLHDCR